MLYLHPQMKRMAKIAGITTTKNAKGEIATITINMKKHGAALLPVLKEMGMIENTQFDRDFENAISIEDFRERLLNHVNTEWKKLH